MQKGSFSTLGAVNFWIPACAGKTERARHRTFAYFLINSDMLSEARDLI